MQSSHFDDKMKTSERQAFKNKSRQRKNRNRKMNCKKVLHSKNYEELGIKCWGGQYVAKGREQTHLLLNGGIYHVPIDKVHKKAVRAPTTATRAAKNEKQCQGCGQIYKLRHAKNGRNYKT